MNLIALFAAVFTMYILISALAMWSGGTIEKEEIK